ncbi:MAG: HAMP domain-containing sensor histidine kinase [Pirellulales bacterium]
MRRPLKFQIMVPMAAVMLLTLAVVASIDVWFAGRHARGQLQRQWQEIGETLNRSTFPLTNVVLGQLRGLSGAEFILVNESGTMLASTPRAAAAPDPPLTELASPEGFAPIERLVKLDGETFLHTAIPLQRQVDDGRRQVLHAFYPESRFRLEWQEAVVPPLTIGLSAIAIVAVVSSWLALRVTRPIAQLRDHVDQLSGGEYAPAPLPERDDELRDLAVAFNSLAARLQKYEQQVRRQEQLTTLDKLAGGMAHQLRNAVAGCRLALDFHRRSCVADDESMRVAVEQLEQIEEYVRRFLAIGKRTEGPRTPVDLAQIVLRVLPLVEGRARHLRVNFTWTAASIELPILGDADSLAQVLINLLLNAVEAAAERETKAALGSGSAAAESEGSATRAGSQVAVDWQKAGDYGRIVIRDNGSGPPDSVRDRLFEPLVSSKPDGVGLGLAIAREVVARHQGNIDWRRRGDWTEFEIEIPLRREEQVHGAVVGGG